MTATTESGRSYRLVGFPHQENALLILVAMHGIPPGFGTWLTEVELALLVARPGTAGMN